MYRQYDNFKVGLKPRFIGLPALVSLFFQHDFEYFTALFFYQRVIKEMNCLCMLVDLSHVSDNVMNEVLNIAQAPVIFSHSGARALCDHPKKVLDDVLLRTVQ